MKTIAKSLLLSVFTLVYTYSVSLGQERIATFFAQDGDKFWVIVDGIRQNEKPAANVKVTGLTKDMYRIKIIFENESLKSVDQTISTVGFVDESEVTKPADVTYMLRRNKDKMVMRVSSFKPANSSLATEPRQESVRFHTEESPVPPATTTQTTTQTTRQQPSTGTTQKVGMDIKTDGINTQVNIQMTEPAELEVETTTTTTRQNNTTPPQTNTQPTNEPPTSQPQGCIKAMNTADFQKAKSSIEAQSFSESKMKVARQAVRGCVNTAQVRDLLGLFSFEADKLALAKFVYDFTTDKNNFYTLSDVFSFSASSDELQDFLESKQK
jgi:hypothetical protein